MRRDKIFLLHFKQFEISQIRGNNLQILKLINLFVITFMLDLCDCPAAFTYVRNWTIEFSENLFLGI